MDENLSDDPTGFTEPTPKEELSEEQLAHIGANLTDEELAEVDALKERILEANGLDITLPDGRTLVAKDFYAMAEFCNGLTTQMLAAFVEVQEVFKKAALSFAQMERLLNKEADNIKKAERENRRTKVENVFENEPDTPPTTT
jgi:hypothetical protein